MRVSFCRQTKRANDEEICKNDSFSEEEKTCPEMNHAFHPAGVKYLL
jgi:hypothetical protein